ncbi:PA14 domain-containing protein [Bernardetia sp. MNP-M8]|uniref:PA14 domain-containing protein n=1 Tax=Bernardetia sp. MNP-M8 TaxID=3127470 RepID=UPI0030CE9C74
MNTNIQNSKPTTVKLSYYKIVSLGIWLMTTLFYTNSHAQTLIFKSGFEGTTRLEPRTPNHEKIKGSNNSSNPSDWENDLVNNPYFGYGEIVYEQGDTTQRNARIVKDPQNTNNKAMRFRITDQHITVTNSYTNKIEHKARIQYNLQNQNAAPVGGFIKEYYQKCRIYFSPDLAILEAEDEDFGWFILQEFWNDPSYDVPRGQARKSTRVDFEITRINHVAGSKLRFGAKFRDPINVYPATWEYINPNFEVPLGKWMTQEIYIKEGDNNTGRIYMAITVDGQKTVIVDKITRTVANATSSYTPDGQTAWNPMKIYMEGKVAKLFKDQGKILDVYWDDLEIWFNRTPESNVGGTTIAAPSQFTATNVQATQATFNWTDNSNNETEFLLERRELPNGQYEVAKIEAIDVTTTLDAALTPSTSYRYRLSAKNATIQSEYTYTDVTTPAAPVNSPSGLTATNVQSKQVTLNWTDNSNNETEFVLEKRNVTAGESYSLLQTLPTDAVTFTDTNLLPNTSYNYRIIAKNATMQSDFIYLNVVTPFAPVNTPSGFTATNVQSTQATLTWNDNSNNETEFVIERRSVTDGGNYALVQSVGTDVTSFTDPTLLPSKDYKYRLSAKNSTTQSTFIYLDVKTPAVIITINAPSGATVTNIQTNQATLTWNDNSNNEAEFIIDRRSVTDGGNYEFLQSVGVDITSFTDPTLSPNKEYRYRISAKNGNVVSDFSYPNSFTTPEEAGTGLQATYYDNMDFTGTSISRTDATVNFNWGNSSPSSSIGANTFSARWTGQIKPAYTGTYTFYTTTDDGVRLWVNDALLINKWNNQSATEYTGTITLNAGQKYSIKLEYFENTGDATAKLSWSSAIQPKQIIPQTALYPAFSPIAKVATRNVTKNSETTITAYPNPAKDILYVRVDKIEQNEVTIELLSSLSQTVKKTNYSTIKGNNTFEMNIQGLASGVYFLKIYNGKEVIVKKIIIE